MLQNHFRADRMNRVISSIILCTNPMILPGNPTGYKSSRILESPHNFQVKMLLLGGAGIQTWTERFHIGFLAIAQSPTRQTSTETTLQMPFHLPLLKQPISQVLTSLHIFLPFQNMTQNIRVWKRLHTEEVFCHYSFKTEKLCNSLNCYPH